MDIYQFENVLNKTDEKVKVLENDINQLQDILLLYENNINEFKKCMKFKRELEKDIRILDKKMSLAKRFNLQSYQTAKKALIRRLEVKYFIRYSEINWDCTQYITLKNLEDTYFYLKNNLEVKEQKYESIQSTIDEVVNGAKTRNKINL